MEKKPIKVRVGHNLLSNEYKNKLEKEIENKPVEGKTYLITGGPNEKCILNGNSWKESEVKERYGWRNKLKHSSIQKRRYSSLQLYNYEKKLYKVKDYSTNEYIKVIRAKDKWIFNNKVFITADELNRYLKTTMKKEVKDNG